MRSSWSLPRLSGSDGPTPRARYPRSDAPEDEATEDEAAEDEADAPAADKADLEAMYPQTDHDDREERALDSELDVDGPRAEARLNSGKSESSPPTTSNSSPGRCIWKAGEKPVDLLDSNSGKQLGWMGPRGLKLK